MKEKKTWWLIKVSEKWNKTWYFIWSNVYALKEIGTDLSGAVLTVLYIFIEFIILEVKMFIKVYYAICWNRRGNIILMITERRRIFQGQRNFWIVAFHISTAKSFCLRTSHGIWQDVCMVGFCKWKNRENSWESWKSDSEAIADCSVEHARVFFILFTS